MDADRQSGVVVSFYSYKGGVGRSFAVANIATVMAQWGFRVLCIDFDIEAPGLSHYFDQWLDAKSTGGLLQYLQDCTEGSADSFSAYVLTPELPGLAGRLELLPSGRSDEDYVGKVQKIDWRVLYRDHDLGAKLERARADAIERFDFVLIDGRTGITDFAGIVTAQLPDILAFLFTANKQSLEGAVDVANRAMLARNGLPFDRGALLPLPIPARFEQREEYKKAEEWKRAFLRGVGKFYDRWVSRGVDFKKILELTTIPYVPYWSFGEEIAVLQETSGSPQAISYHLETLAALLAHRLSRTELLASSRDEYVDAARRLAQRHSVQRIDVFVSYPTKYFEQAKEVVTELTRKGLNIFWYGGEKMRGDWLEESNAMLGAAKNLVILVADRLGPIQQQEVYTFMRQSLADKRVRPVVPLVVSSGGKRELELDSTLANFREIDIRGRSIRDALPELLELLEPQSPPRAPLG